MITIPASDTIAGAAPTGATEVTCTLFLMELNTATSAETYTKDQQQLAAAAATIYTATANGPTFVKAIHVVNTDASNASTFQLFAGGTAAANAITPVFTLLAGGVAVYSENGWQFFDSNGLLQIMGGPATILTGGTLTSATLTSNATANSTTTGVEVHQISIGAAGTYIFEWSIVYESAATTTGISLGINYTGTETVLLGWMEYPGTGTAATTGAASMVATGATGQIHESFGFRAASTTVPNMGATVSVDAASTNPMMCKVVGVLVCTDAGDLELWHASEVAASSTVRAGTTVLVHRVN